MDHERRSAERRRSGTAAIARPEHSEQRIRVLVVDDDATLLETVEAILEDDFDVRCCQSGPAALTLLASEEFDVVCTDYKMPVMDGVELLKRITDLKYGVGAVLMTGKAEAYHQEQLQSSDAAKSLPLSVVVKPYSVEELIDAINRAAAFARMRRAVNGASRTLARSKRHP